MLNVSLNKTFPVELTVFNFSFPACYAAKFDSLVGVEEGGGGGRWGWRKVGVEEGWGGGRLGWRKVGVEGGEGRWGVDGRWRCVINIPIRIDRF